MRIVLNYYGLREQPFGETPDPRFTYLAGTHREALASLTSGVLAGRGFMTLIAKPGMGKTTLLFHLLRSLQNSASTVFLFQTLRSPQDLLRGLLEDLGIETPVSDLVQMHSTLNQFLLQQSRKGKRVIVAIDEAQNLDASVLEVVRMLSNFETSRQKLMQIILAGQPQLACKLASPELMQLRQRISIVSRIKTLTTEESLLYIVHRLRVAGYAFEQPLFTQRALRLIAQRAAGIPRNISALCFNAMSLGCVLNQKTIAEEVIGEVLSDADLSALDLDGARADVSEIHARDAARAEEEAGETTDLRDVRTAPQSAENTQRNIPVNQDRESFFFRHAAGKVKLQGGVSRRNLR